MVLYLRHWRHHRLRTPRRNMRYRHWRQVWCFAPPLGFECRESYYKDKTVLSLLWDSYTGKTYLYTTRGVTLRKKIETARCVVFRKEILMCFVWYLRCYANRREQQWNLHHLSMCKHKVKFIKILNFLNLTTRCTSDPYGIIISRLWSNFHHTPLMEILGFCPGLFNSWLPKVPLKLIGSGFNLRRDRKRPCDVIFRWHEKLTLMISKRIKVHLDSNKNISNEYVILKARCVCVWRTIDSHKRNAYNYNIWSSTSRSHLL